MGASPTAYRSIHGKDLGLTPRGLSVYGRDLRSGGAVPALDIEVFVDSVTGNDNSNGLSPDHAFATLDAAVAATTADKGDIIYVMAGHAEDLAADSAVDLDVAGITVIGLGHGEQRPTFTFTTAAGADFKMAAADLLIHNLLFITTQDSLAMMVEVSGDDAEISHCEFRGNATQQMLIAVATVATNTADRLYIHDCTVINDTAGATSAFDIVAVQADVRIENCYVRGDFSEACIESSDILTDVRITGNSLQNDSTGIQCIELSAAATGDIANNLLSNDDYGVALDPGSCKLYGNRWSDSATADTGDIPIPAEGLDAVTAGALPRTFTTGERFFVDSGHADAADVAGYGTNPRNPFATVDFANDQCTADNGDIIYAMPGHNENFSGTDDIDLDTAGVSLIGLGSGDNVPRFDYDATASEIVIGASGVLIENIRMRPGLDAVTNAINVEAAGDFFTIRNCRFGDAEAATDEFADAVIVEAGANNGVIEDNHFESGAQAAVSCVELNGAVLGLKIRRNYMLGDYSTACIRGDSTASEAVIIEDNLLWNGTHAAIGTVAVISLLTGTTGVIRNNDIICDVLTPDLAIVLGATPGCFQFNNRYNETPTSFDVETVSQRSHFLTNAMVTASMATNNNYETADTPDVWTVTGRVKIRCWARVVTGLTSTCNNGSMQLGITGNINLLGVLEVADATAFATGDWWGHTGTSLVPGGVLDDFVVLDAGDNVFLTFATNNMTAGKVTFYCEWIPLDPEATVVAAALPT